MIDDEWKSVEILINHIIAYTQREVKMIDLMKVREQATINFQHSTTSFAVCVPMTQEAFHVTSCEIRG
jgi:hypothetical protein